MKITSKFILKDRLNSDNTQTIIFRVIFNRSILRHFTDIRILEDFWDKTNSRVKPGHIDFSNFNLQLDLIQNNFNTFITDCKFKHTPITEIAIKSFLNNSTAKNDKNDFLKFIKNDMDNTGKNVLKNTTYKNQISQLKMLKDYCDKIYFEDINTDFLYKYEAFLKSKFKPGTVNQKITFLRNYINKAIDQNLCKEYIFRKYKLQRVISKPKFLSTDEFDILLKYYNTDISKFNKKVLHAFLFSCYSGLRFSDIKNLKFENIRDNRIYIIVQKTNRILTIPLNNHLIELMPENTGNKYLFKLGTNGNVNRILKHIGEDSKVNRILTFHIARHTFATISLNIGIPLVCLQSLLGHNQISSTQIYAKVIDKTLEKEMEKWNNSTPPPLADAV